MLQSQNYFLIVYFNRLHGNGKVLPRQITMIFKLIQKVPERPPNWESDILDSGSGSGFVTKFFGLDKSLSFVQLPQRHCGRAQLL